MQEDFVKYMTTLYNNPLFKKGFQDFSQMMQEQGIKAAMKAWEMSPEKNKLFDKAPAFFEQMFEFYSNLGFVHKSKYDEVVKENEELKKENEFLRDTIQKLNLKVFAEGSGKVQDAWKETIDKQLNMSQEITRNFLDFFTEMGKNYKKK